MGVYWANLTVIESQIIEDGWGKSTHESVPIKHSVVRL